MFPWRIRYPLSQVPIKPVPKKGEAERREGRVRRIAGRRWERREIETDSGRGRGRERERETKRDKERETKSERQRGRGRDARTQRRRDADILNIQYN